MAAPSYTTDLSNFYEDESSAWLEFTNMISGGSPDEGDADNRIQGSYMISQTTNTTGFVSMGKDNGSGITVPTDGAVLVWMQHTSPGAIATYANGGMRIVIGSSSANYKMWAVGGSDVSPNPYGGWQNLAVDPTVTADYTYGSPTSTLQVIGSAINMVTAIAKGQPHQVDAVRYGRCEARFAGGDEANGYATFSGFAAVNDNNSYRWGLIQAVMGGYLWKGLITLGYSSAVDFRDSNKIIFIQDTRKVGANFNKIEIRQTGSRVDWTGISFINVSPSTCAAKGRFEVIDDADVNLDGCLFVDMDTFIFKSQSTILGTTFRRCNAVTQNSAVFTGCLFDKSTDTAALKSNNVANVTNCDFVSDGSSHAIEITATGTYALTGCSFSGYATSNGDTGNEVIYNNSGGAVTLNLSGVTGTVSVKNGSGASTTVNSTINLTITNIVSGSDVVVYEAGTTTVLDDSQENSGSTWVYSYSTGGVSVDIGVFKAGYRPFYIRSYSLPSSNGTLPVSQSVDRDYLD